MSSLSLFQIHIFNQRAIVALKETHSCILLDKIDPKQCNPALLGEIPKSVHRLPFRLDDIPYFDTTFLCDPVMDQYYTPGTGNDSDNDSWDAPLKRTTSTVASKIQASAAGNSNNRQQPYSQHSQTNLSGLAGEFTNINEPYSRDPNATFNPIGKRRGSKSFAPMPPQKYGGGGGGQCQRHSPSAANSSPHELRARFEQMSGNQSGSLKKRSAPRMPPPPAYDAPSPTPRRRSSFGKKTHAPMTPSRPSSSGYEFRGMDQTGGMQKMNPVREMQLRGAKARSAEDNEDGGAENPPFNFQAMLRKTKHNRASMKRTTLDEHTMFPSESDGYGRPASPFGGGSAGRSSPYGQSNNGNGGGQVRIRTPDSDRSQTSHTVYKSSRPQSRQSNGGGGSGGFDENDNRASTPSWLDRGNSLEEAFYVNEEIQPGVMLEGYAIEI